MPSYIFFFWNEKLIALTRTWKIKVMTTWVHWLCCHERTCSDGEKFFVYHSAQFCFWTFSERFLLLYDCVCVCVAQYWCVDNPFKKKTASTKCWKLELKVLIVFLWCHVAQKFRRQNSLIVIGWNFYVGTTTCSRGQNVTWTTLKAFANFIFLRFLIFSIFNLTSTP